MSTIQCESIFDLIQNNLKPGLINRLYGGDGLVSTDAKNVQQTSNENEVYSNQVSWACKAIFQSLPSLSKHVSVPSIYCLTTINSNTNEWFICEYRLY